MCRNQLFSNFISLDQVRVAISVLDRACVGCQDSSVADVVSEMGFLE